jgi:glycosyltransferase involved in cell wall biosynthesis
MGGTETYAREVLGRLARSDEVDLTAFTNVLAAGSLADVGVPECMWKGVTGGAPTWRRVTTLAQAALDPRLRRRVAADADLVFYPFTVPVPRVPSLPWVMALHDVQHLDLPHLFSRAERAYRRRAYDHPAGQATAVVTISEFSRGRIIERLGLQPDRVSVAHMGVGSHFRPAPRDGIRPDAVDAPYVFYPAWRYPHKNHQRLVEAMRKVRSVRPDLRLVLSGGGPDVADAPSWVTHAGIVGSAELVDLYRSAACVVFPSLYEGFGMPPLEAMACGTPVASSTAGALPEVVGDAAVLFDPEDVDAMSGAILAAIDRREELAELGQRRAASFTWDACAAAHLAVFQGTLATRAAAT